MEELVRYLDYLVVAAIAILIYRWLGEPLHGVL